jgi:transcriptional regulator with XRE-family HTH domain
MSTQTLERFRSFSPARLAAARRRSRLTQQATATAVGLFIRHYQKIEAGEVNPTAAQLGRFATLFRVTIDSLYAMPEEGAAP